MISVNLVLDDFECRGVVQRSIHEARIPKHLCNFGSTKYIICIRVGGETKANSIYYFCGQKLAKHSPASHLQASTEATISKPPLLYQNANIFIRGVFF